MLFCYAFFSLRIANIKMKFFLFTTGDYHMQKSGDEKLLITRNLFLVLSKMKS